MVTRALQVPQHDELQQVAEVQAGSGGVEAAVGSDRPVGQRLAQLLLVRGLCHQPTPLQLVEDVLHPGVPFASWGARVVHGAT